MSNSNVPKIPQPLDAIVITEGSSRYEFFNTADGSPTICLSSDKFRPEAMHHREGALAESLFVYHGVLQEGLGLGCPARVLSVGLGCAYNEMIAVGHFLRAGTWPSDFYLESFEGDPNLRESFRAWLANDSLEPAPSPTLPTLLSAMYTRVSEIVSAHFQIEPSRLKFALRELHETNRFVLREWLAVDTKFDRTFGVIFFDAFSGKSTPELWSEEFLVTFLTKTAAEKCGLATYAATGTLNRALKRNGFVSREQKGFAFKRESTRAFKE